VLSRRQSTLLRVFGAAAITVVFGAVSASLVFSDLGPNESVALRVIASAAAAFFSGFAFGWLVPRLRYLGFLASWGALLLAAVALVLRFTRPSDGPMWAMTLGCLSLPLVSLSGSCLGARRARRSSSEAAG
jgi:hypothetical protein